MAERLIKSLSVDRELLPVLIREFRQIHGLPMRYCCETKECLHGQRRVDTFVPTIHSDLLGHSESLCNCRVENGFTCVLSDPVLADEAKASWLNSLYGPGAIIAPNWITIEGLPVGLYLNCHKIKQVKGNIAWNVPELLTWSKTKAYCDYLMVKRTVFKCAFFSKDFNFACSYHCTVNKQFDVDELFAYFNAHVKDATTFVNTLKARLYETTFRCSYAKRGVQFKFWPQASSSILLGYTDSDETTVLETVEPDGREFETFEE